MSFIYLFFILFVYSFDFILLSFYFLNFILCIPGLIPIMME